MLQAKQHRRVVGKEGIIILLATVLALGGCDTDFDPIQESNRHFSVFGFLDAAADTQFIRVTPVRNAIALSPRPFDAVVALENLDTGSKTILQDSLFDFDGRVAYNFWTAEPVEHEAVYRLSATRSDGAASAVTITLPPAYPDPELLLPPQMAAPPSTTAAIRLANVERLAELQIVFTFRLPGAAADHTNTIALSYLERVAPLGGNLGVQFRPYNDFFGQVAGCPIVEDAQVIVAAAGPDWPDFLTIDDETLALADVVTNVENGVGFVGGVSRKTVPWERLRTFLLGTQANCVQCTSFRNSRSCFGGPSARP